MFFMAMGVQYARVALLLEPRLCPPVPFWSERVVQGCVPCCCMPTCAAPPPAEVSEAEMRWR